MSRRSVWGDPADRPIALYAIVREAQERRAARRRRLAARIAAIAGLVALAGWWLAVAHKILVLLAD